MLRIVALSILLIIPTSSCRTLFSSTELAPLSVQLPYMRNSSNECYYLDEFMPTPDSLVTGKNGSLGLRYYSYKGANYKEWQNIKLNLAFYSNDLKCWSLYEEFYTVN